MFINETYSDMPQSQCDKCKNNDICKWKEEFIKVNTSISDTIFDKDLPIQITVSCKRYFSNNSRVY